MPSYQFQRLIGLLIAQTAAHLTQPQCLSQSELLNFQLQLCSARTSLGGQAANVVDDMVFVGGDEKADERQFVEVHTNARGDTVGAERCESGVLELVNAGRAGPNR